MQIKLLLCVVMVSVALPVMAQQANPPAHLRMVHDAQDRLSFQLPADWPMAVRDHELSTFHQEARSAPATARVRYVAAMPENPFPASTFSGAHFYLSVTPRQTEAQCAAQAAPLPNSPPDASRVGHLPASHVHDESGTICTQFRDEVYTLPRRGACLRFDLAMNNFCGGAVSGVREMSPAEMQDVRRRLETILDSIVFQP